MISEICLSDAAGPLAGQMTAEDACFSRVSIDTRTLSAGDLYVAIKGENFDGHRFIPQAQEAGAVAAIVSAPSDCPLPQLCVSDTRIALGQLGALNRKRFSGKVLAITGSTGKTTVKEMAAAILGVDYRVHATYGNFNNDIGVPLMLLALEAKHEKAVFELGASALGEIAYTTALVNPDVSILTNAGEAHVEGFGSLENIVIGKGEIIEGLSEHGIAVINADDAHAAHWIRQAGDRRVITFGLDESSGADVYAADCREDAAGRFSFRLETPYGSVGVALPQLGLHNVCNALAAAAGTLAMGADLTAVKTGLEAAETISGRLVKRKGKKGSWVFDDTYNANPASMRAAIDVLAKQDGERWLVMGDMAELGKDAQARHDEVVNYAREQGIEQVWGVGTYCAAALRTASDDAKAFDDQQQLIEQLTESLNKNINVLVKGSRSAQMENVVAAILGDVNHAV